MQLCAFLLDRTDSHNPLQAPLVIAVHKATAVVVDAGGSELIAEVAWRQKRRGAGEGKAWECGGEYKVRRIIK